MPSTNKKKSMGFQIRQSHNLHDVEVGTSDDGRTEVRRHVQRRIGFIVSILAGRPRGVDTISQLVELLNKKFPGSAYTFNDVAPSVRKAIEVSLVLRNAGGGYRLAPRGQEAWKALNKVTRDKVK